MVKDSAKADLKLIIMDMIKFMAIIKIKAGYIFHGGLDWGIFEAKVRYEVEIKLNLQE